ncbi:MAG: VOC family protein [Saprospiraceae bacterium]|nr:VOC family protein [Saprospiraceae bacterium]MDW8228209.1 VOC family protein [Saprospiraceae bacterium]
MNCLTYTLKFITVEVGWRLALTTALSLSLLACRTAERRPAAALPADDNTLLFKRTTLVVSNIERSLGIYRDILGFTLNAPVSESSAESYSYPVFRIPKEAKIRFVTLDTKTQERTLALTEVTGVPLPKPDQPIMSALVIRVPDIAATIQKIKALGLETTEPKTARSANGKFAFIEQAFVDYDGHLIVLYQMLK